MELLSSSSDQIEQAQCFACSSRRDKIKNIQAMNLSINTVASIRGTVAVKR